VRLSSAIFPLAGEQTSSDQNALASYLQSSIEAERSQLTRELHDDLGGLLVGALMDVAWVEARVESPDLKAKLRRARDALRAAVDLKRNLIEAMRPTLIENVGLFAAMRWHFTKFCGATALQCSVELAGPEPTLKPNVAIAIYRVAEEALRLISAALQARSITLSAEVSESTLLLQFSHNGGGPTDAVLANLPDFASMSHRISRLQGELKITPAVGGAAQWCIGVPIGEQ
jgi:signal transduction histidine kinase